MAVVRLYKRSAVGATRAAAVKKPFIPDIDTAGAIAGLTGEVFDRIWEVQAGNEESEMIGGVKTALQRMETALVDRPGMSPEEFDKLKETTRTDIGNLGKIATLPRSKLFWENYTKQKKGQWEEQMNTRGEEIKSQQELTKLKAEHDRARAELDIPGLQKSFDDMVLAGLMAPDVATEIFKAEVAKIAVAKAVAWLDGQVTQIASEAGWGAAGDYLNDPETSKALAAFGLSTDDIDKVFENVRTQIAYNKKKDKEAQAKLYAKTEAEAFNLHEKGELTTDWVTDSFNAGEMSKTDRDAYLRMMRTDVELNYPEYDKVVDIIDGVAKGTKTEDDADKAIKAGVGKFYNANEAKQLRTKLSQNLKPGSPTKRPAHTRGITTIEEVFDARISWATKTGDYDFEAESRDLQVKNRMKNDLDAWILENPNSTDEQIEKKVSQMLEPIKVEAVGDILSRLWEQFIIGTGGRGLGFGTKELPEPSTEAEWEAEVARLKTVDIEKARDYYDKWNQKW